MDGGSLGLLALGFGLGLVHALDADHVAAVSALAARRASPLACLRFALQWATGHGLVLLASVLLLSALGLALPEVASGWAEALVGVVLVVLGVRVWWDLARQRLRVRLHQHGDWPPHAHWQRDDASERHGHAPLLVGALHGLAGSAPLLATLPVLTQEPLWLGVLAVAIFGLGVLAAMACFGGALALALRSLAERARWLAASRAVAGTASVLAGGWLIATHV
ncbi:MAG: urease accessory protein [Proteobacteria bacterium]|nr:urease accessory protein [Pseudomonadota bacterium]